MNACPNCRTLLEDDVRLCPHCGAAVAPVWPPAPEGQTTPVPHKDIYATNGVITGLLFTALLYYFLLPFAFFYKETPTVRHLYLNPRQLRVLNIVFRYGTWTVNLVPLVVVGGLYLLLRRRYPSFARGLGYSLIVIGVLLLWGLATCRS